MYLAMFIDIATLICPTHFCILIHDTHTLTTEHPEYVPGKKWWPEVQLTQDKLTCEWQMAEVAIAVPHLLRRHSMQNFNAMAGPWLGLYILSTVPLSWTVAPSPQCRQ